VIGRYDICNGCLETLFTALPHYQEKTSVSHRSFVAVEMHGIVKNTLTMLHRTKFQKM